MCGLLPGCKYVVTHHPNIIIAKMLVKSPLNYFTCEIFGKKIAMFEIANSDQAKVSIKV